MSAHRNADRKLSHLDYCLNILGIRVYEASCILIAKGDGNWGPIGPTWSLPIEIPRNAVELHSVGTDTLRLTAWQYEREHPETDIRDVLSQRKSFGVALNQHD